MRMEHSLLRFHSIWIHPNWSPPSHQLGGVKSGTFSYLAIVVYLVDASTFSLSCGVCITVKFPLHWMQCIIITSWYGVLQSYPYFASNSIWFSLALSPIPCPSSFVFCYLLFSAVLCLFSRKDRIWCSFRLCKNVSHNRNGHVIFPFDVNTRLFR